LSLHKYLYCRANPENGSDPTGHDDVVDILSMDMTLDSLGQRLYPVERAVLTSYAGTTTSAQRAIIDSALDEARKYADDAFQFTQGITTHNTPARYVRWFGAPDQGRIEHVKDVWSSVDASVWGPLTFKATTGNYYGLTYPLLSSTVRLGRDFWDSTTPLTGEDSKAGTIIHELTHIVGGTGDKAYGSQNCLTLAINHPGKAVRNADTYEYFVELK
jgi:peptidyl-Lys metalloendopeptidase